MYSKVPKCLIYLLWLLLFSPLNSDLIAQTLQLGVDPTDDAQCHCLNNATSLLDGQFVDTLTVISMPGETWTLVNTSTGVYSTTSAAPPAIPISANGTTLTDLGSGVYQLIFLHVDGEGYSAQVGNGTTTLSASNTCYYPDISFVGLPDTICLSSAPLPITVANGGIGGSGNITINGNPATVFDSNNLSGPGNYTVTYTFDAGTGTPNDANDPGCVSSISKMVVVPPQPTTSISAVVNITLGPDCETVVTPDMMLTGDYPCLDDFTVIIFNQDGDPIGNTVTAEHTGQRLDVIVQAEVDAYTGFGQIDVFDNIAPQIDCTPANTMPMVEDTVQLLSGSIPAGASTFIPSNFLCYAGAVAPLSGNHFYQLQSFSVDQVDIYTIELNMPVANGGAFGLYEGDFNPFLGPCQNIAGVSEAQPAGGGYFSGATDVAKLHLRLVPGRTYTLLTTTFDGNLSANYDYAFYSAGDGRIQITGQILPETVGVIQLPLYCSSIPGLLNNPASVDQLGAPQQLDACVVAPNITFTDLFVNGGDCAVSSILRTFTATDLAGNSSTCTQSIDFPPLGMEAVSNPPATFTLDCSENFATDDEGNPHPSVTGYPFVITADGVFDLTPFYCNMLASYTDLSPVNTCTGSEQFVRRWTIFDNCGNTPLRIFDQRIIIADQTGPVLSCPAPILPNGQVDTLTFATEGTACGASFMVPMPTVMDDCSGWSVTTEIVVQTLEPITNPLGQIIGFETVESIHATILPNANRLATNVPVGIHFFRFIATDDCSNSNQVECPFRVEDFALPTAVCDDLIHISLGGNGLGSLTANDIDEGSNDNCGPVTLQLRRVLDFDPLDCSEAPAINTLWGPEITLYCCDVNDTVDVTLQVMDLGGNTNFCNSRVLVEDYTVPLCVAPPPVNTTCDALPPSTDLTNTATLTELFGAPEGIDACPGTSIIELAPQINDQNCGLSNIVRQFTVSDAAGNSNSCQQIINISGNTNYRIRFPADFTGECATDGPDTLVLENMGCDNFSINISDETYEVTDDACYKILRTYNVTNWCQYDGFSPPVEISRDPDCNGEGGENPVWLIRGEDGIAYIDADDDPTNGFPVAGTRGFVCGGGTNPEGYWFTRTPNGNWQYTQVIKIIDSGAPVINAGIPEPVCTLNNNCEAEANIGFSISDGGCSTEVPNVTATVDLFSMGDFSTSITVTGTFPNFQAIGTFPIGEHRLRITAEDNCGNDALIIVDFSIVDCNIAGLICNNMMSVTLMAQEPGVDADGDGDEDAGARSVQADMFINFTGEDCSAPLRSTIHRISDIEDGSDVPFPNHPALVVTCDEIGVVPVRVYLWDSAFNPYAVQPDGTTGGPNYTTCDAVLIVQDNNSVCTGGTTNMGTVNGLIITEDGIPASNVQVSPGGSMADDMDMTEDNGLFTFDLPTEEGYQITPYAPEDYLNGVTTFDIILIAKHILGVDPLDSPYQLIAADVNHSNTITTLDLVHLRKLILGISETFPNNDSWRYIHAGFEFPDPNNPWLEPFPESMTIPMLMDDVEGVDFIAVKVGDVNGNAQPNANESYTEQRADAIPYYLRAQDVRFAAGETVELTLVPADVADQVQGFQFSLEFATDALQLANVEWDMFAEEHLYTGRAEQGLLNISWDARNGMPEETQTTFCTIRFTSLQAGRLSEVLAITSRGIVAEAYGLDDSLRPMGLSFNSDFNTATTTETGKEFYLEQNRPNPFGDQTIIGFHIPEAGIVNLTIYDTNGKRVQQYQQYFAAGYNQMLVDAKDIAVQGLLYYTLETGQYTATKKMIILEH